MKMKIAFLMDGLESIDPLHDTTSHLMYECNQRGHLVFFLESHDVYVRKNEVVARMRKITSPRNLSMKRYWRSLIRCLKKDELIFENVTDLDALFFRKNLPLHYGTMEYLAPLEDQVFMINSTTGQVLASSQLYILNFPEIIPETHISRDPTRLKKIIHDFGGSMVVKPLQRYLGEGVIKVSARDQENLHTLIHYYVKAFEAYPNREPVMVQEYLNIVKEQGDVRILLLNGEILGAMRRKPREGDFRTNVNTGAKLYRHKVTPKQREICMAIKDKLVKDGLFLWVLILLGRNSWK